MLCALLEEGASLRPGRNKVFVFCFRNAGETLLKPHKFFKEKRKVLNSDASTAKLHIIVGLCQPWLLMRRPRFCVTMTPARLCLLFVLHVPF